MTEAVQIELIRTGGLLLTGLISLYAAHQSSKAKDAATEVKTAVSDVKTEVVHLAHATNSILEQARNDARTQGEADGRAAGIEQERNRTS